MNLSYVHGVGTTPLLADTSAGALDRAAERWGDRDALVACPQQLRYSYRELRDEADRAARAPIALGVQRGDRVGIWSGNRAEWMITQYAASKAGAILVNINPAYRPRELEYALSHSGVSVLITARGFRSTDYVDMLLGLVPELTATRTGQIFADRLPALRRVVYLGSDAQPGGIAWADFLELGHRIEADEFEARETTRQFDDPVAREIEEFLHTHEKVTDVQVIGVPDPKYGEEVCPWIRLHDGVTATQEEFRDFCRQIATFKIPRYIRFTREFPMTVTGKVQKFRMREITVAELALARVTNVEPT